MSAQTRDSLLPSLIDVCHRLYARVYVTATDGNVSARLDNGNILTTRSGVNKGQVGKSDFVEITTDGRVVSGTGKPSTESAMHLFIYKERPDVRAVVHAHPPYATGFATARIPLDSCVFPEVIVGLGAIPLAIYATPSTAEVSESMRPYVGKTDAILLANHGVVTYGAELMEAYFKMEKVEHAAHITFVARMLGGEKSLSREEVSRLGAVSPQSYGKKIGEGLACTPDPHPLEGLTEEELRAHVLRSLQKLGIG